MTEAPHGVPLLIHVIHQRPQPTAVEDGDATGKAACATDGGDADNAEDYHEDRNGRCVVTRSIAVVLGGEVQRPSVDDPGGERDLEQTHLRQRKAGDLQRIDAAEAA